MELNGTILKNEERAAFMLRALYQRYGFSQYKMSKFEEYDLYARNRDFLVSDDIISFTDKTGRLMALKPDVTLSIVRNSRDAEGIVDRVCYNENVYRVPAGSSVFKEIMQAGLECIGDIDDYNIFETVFLAAKSLDIISGENVLNISHLGILTSLLDRAGLIGEGRKKALGLIADKNMHELKALLEEKKATGIDDFIRILRLGGSPSEVIAGLKSAGCDEKPVEDLEKLTDALREAGVSRHISIDFSVVSDVRYYNGIVFKGYISGVPGSVLSGGQYDKLLKKLGKRSRAIGFAVYLDFLERYFENDSGTDIDAVIKYDSGTPSGLIYRAVSEFAQRGLTCAAVRKLPEKQRFKSAYTIDKNGSLSRLRDLNREDAPDDAGKEAYNA